MTFLRLQGCNLRCPFCDTPDALEGTSSPGAGETLTVSKVFDRLYEYSRYRVVCVTGGEPLLQLYALHQLTDRLHAQGFTIHLETNGSITLTDGDAHQFDWITVSPKGPRWTFAIPPEHVKEVKLVVPSEKVWRAESEQRYPTYVSLNLINELFTMLGSKTFVWFQPESNGPEAIKFAMQLVRDYHDQLRVGLSLQIHKLIGVR